MMPSVSTPAIVLTPEQRTELESLIRAQRSPQSQVMRAKIVLWAAKGQGVRETARRLGVTRVTVQQWRRRWQQGGQEASVKARLCDAPRSGAPAKFVPEQICAIVALACEPAPDSGLPLTHWTQQALADEAQRRGLVDAISQRSVGRFLKRSRPQTASGTDVADTQAR